MLKTLVEKYIIFESNKKISMFKTLVEKYSKFQFKNNFNKEITKFIFKKLSNKNYVKMMNDSNNMPNNNMYRMFISLFREYIIAHLLNMKYVGDEKGWETDCIYPNYINCNEKFHIKYEIKTENNIFLKNGDTRGIIIKNGRAEGSKVISLFDTILKNNFILIDGNYPYNIVYVNPYDLMFYTKYKKDAKKYKDIINDEDLCNTKCAELKAYAKKKDLIYLREYDDYEKYNNNIKSNQEFNPLKKLIVQYILDNF